jgi:hypothetical protein
MKVFAEVGPRPHLGGRLWWPPGSSVRWKCRSFTSTEALIPMTDDRLPLAERSYGSFEHQLTLPADVDPDPIVAKYAKGILKLELNKDKKAANRVRKIAIG